MRNIWAALVLLTVAGCVSPTRVPEGQEGPILHYLRSNRDGSAPEHVVQFRPSSRQVAVYKWVDKCTTAAFVTAQMDESVREAESFVAGKVSTDGSQARFGTLTLDSRVSALVVDVTPAGGPRLQQRHALKGRPFILYDFDFADLNAFLQEHRPRAAFRYRLPVIWPSDPRLFRDYGTLTASFAREEQHLGRRTARFDLEVDGGTRTSGTLWIDAAQGFIVEAELGLPNHEEYRDFRLRLERVERGGSAAWAALTKGHYANCPTGN